MSLAPRYATLASQLSARKPASVTTSYLRTTFLDALLKLWEGIYTTPSGATAEMVAVPDEGFTYLFDIAHGRALGMAGIMRGKCTLPRPGSRMRQHPKQGGSGYHRGHMAPHSGHGGTDINLFGQLGSMNIGGDWRKREDRAVAAAGSLYFVGLIYPATSDTQVPSEVDHGLILPGTTSIDGNTATN